MPEAQYIIAGESVIQDKVTNLLSVINVIERVDVTVVPRTRGDEEEGGTVTVSSAPCAVVAVWRKEPEDQIGDVIEGQFVIHLPGQSATETDLHEFKVDEKPLNRMILRMTLAEGVKQGGVMRVECRVRRKGTEGWVSQNYEVPVNISEAGCH